MATAILSRPAEPQSTVPSPIRLRVIAVLSAWLLLVVSLGVSGAFVGRPGTPPVAMAIGAAAPLLLFFAWLRLSESFRDFVLSLDIRLIVGMQAWRWAGLGFLSLYAHNVLPAIFALPAGLGDMTVGVTAPWIIVALIRRPAFAASAAFIRWNVFGILDLVLALTLGTVSLTLATGAAGEVSTAPMATLPLLLIPAFLVPLFIMLHTAALMQSRRVARG